MPVLFAAEDGFDRDLPGVAEKLAPSLMEWINKTKPPATPQGFLSILQALLAAFIAVLKQMGVEATATYMMKIEGDGLKAPGLVVETSRKEERNGETIRTVYMLAVYPHLEKTGLLRKKLHYTKIEVLGVKGYKTCIQDKCKLSFKPPEKKG